MAYTREKKTKDGRRYYEIEVSRGRGKGCISRRWYVPDGWSNRAIKHELMKVCAELERKVEDGEVVSRQDVKTQKEAEILEKQKIKTVKQYVENVFMPTKEVIISENARASYQSNLDKHIYPALGDYPLQDVSPVMIQKFLLDFQKNHAHSTCIKIYNIINGIFGMAFLDDTIEKNPMMKVKRPVPKKDEKGKNDMEKALTVEKLNYVLDCVKSEPLKWQAYILLAADSAARRGELCGACWSDIDWREQTITFSRNLQYTSEKGVYLTTPKNGKSRVVDIGQDTLDVLKRLQREQSRSCISKYIFTQEGSAEPMFPQSPNRYFQRFAKKYGIQNFHPHTLRHTSASISITSGGDVVSVSERLGHSDTAVTLRMYAHANPESVRKAGQAVRDALRAAMIHNTEPDHKQLEDFSGTFQLKERGA